MKKLLVLMLVLGMTSMASATITSKMNIQSMGGNLWQIQIDNLNNVDDGLGGYWYLIGDAANPVTGGAIAATIPAGFAAMSAVLGDAGDTGWVGYGLGRWGSFATATSPYSTSPAVYADNFVWADAGYSGPDITISLYSLADDFGSVELIDSVTIPEPMTVALLGLGSLFLLRRRK
jgi:hypothetical protein